VTDYSDQRWLAAAWPSVRRHLPPPPARVLDVGCGPLGGFVPALRAQGYDAEGIDPEAPEGPHYVRIEFEEHAATRLVAAVVASTSLHHVADLDDVAARMAAALASDGVLVVLEWAWERFDDATARWCFARLPEDDAGWLHRHRDNWIASGQSWEAYLGTWAANEGLHTGAEVIRVLRTRFDTQLLADGPYLFADLEGVAPADEQAAVDAGRIRAVGITYVGRPRAAGAVRDG
jgi:SAM-dependent methyltransferase